MRAGLHVLAVIAIVLLSGMILQAVVEADQRRRFPAPGQLVDIGNGQLIHIRVWGEDKPGPTILLQTSAAWMLSEWAWIGPDLGRDFRVVATDRPGMGWSVGGSRPRDALAAAQAFGAALDATGIGPPYVLVGHSFGGLATRAFFGLHPDDVLGMVLLDTTAALPGSGGYYSAVFGIHALVGHSGAYQLVPPPSGVGSLPPDEVERARAVSLWTTHMDTTAEEMAAWDRTVEQALSAGSFGDLPLLVVSAPGAAQHLELQREMATLSTNSRYVHLPTTEHTQMLIVEDQAAVTAQLIREFVVALP